MKNRPPLSAARTAILSLLMSSLLAALAGCSDSEVKLLGSARGYLEKGDRNAAIIQLKTTLQKYPQSGEARILMGRALLESGDAVGAEVELNKALDQRMPPDEVVPLLAKALLTQGQGRKLIERFAQTSLGEPKPAAELAAALAGAHLAVGKKDEGLREIEKALKLDESNARARLMRAQLAAADGQLQEAMQMVDAMIAGSLDKPAALVLKASIHVAMERNAEGTEKARQALEAAVAVKPDHVPAHTALIALAQLDRDPQALRTRLEAFQKVAPRHPLALLVEADLSLRDDKRERARELTDQMLKMAPGDARVQMLASRVAERTGNSVQAEVHAAKAVQLAPAWAEARRQLANHQIRSGQVKRALDTLQPLLESERTEAETYALAGQALLQDGQAAKAEGFLRKASELKPQDGRLRTMNALAQMGRGRDGEVMLELESIASNDQGTTADMALISTRLQSRDFDGALRAAQGLRRKQPDNPLPLQIEAQVHLAKGDRAAARKSLEAAVAVKADYIPAAAALATMDLQDGQADKARGHFERALKANRRSAPAHLALVELKARDGASAPEIRTALEAAVKAAPDAPALRVALVNHLLGGVKDKRAALAAAQEADSALADQPELIDALGRAQLANDAKEQAAGTFRRLLQLQPENVAFQIRLAESQATTGDHAEAVRTLRKALEGKPDHLGAQQNLLASLLALNKHAEAKIVAKDVQRQRPKEPIGWMFEGDIALHAKQADAAVSAYRTAMGLSRNTQTVMKLHNALLEQGRLAEAAELTASWLRASPNDLTFLGYVADVAIRRQAWAEAEVPLRSFIKLQPDNAVILNNLAYALVQQRKEGAVEAAEKANRLLPGTPVIMDTLALALAATRQFPKAIELQKAAVDKSNGDHALRFNLAKIYVASGDKPAARKELEQLAALGDRFPQQPMVSQMLKSL